MRRGTGMKGSSDNLRKGSEMTKKLMMMAAALAVAFGAWAATETVGG